MSDLKVLAKQIFTNICLGEMALAYDQYTELVDQLIQSGDEQWLIQCHPLLIAMLEAQETHNMVWLSDLIGYRLIPALDNLDESNSTE